MTEHAFVAEVSEVLRLVIHSLYSNRDIFLRELVSNASDALDKRRFRALTDTALMPEGHVLEVKILVDAAAGTLTIQDSGIGMSEEELVKNLGTVAHSGTKALLSQLGDKKGDLSLIGQFGVGFYSAYLVADRVDVITCAAGEGSKAFKWSSDAKSSFTVEASEWSETGTQVVLHLREDAKEFLESWKLANLVRTYSDYVTYPVRLAKEDKDGAVVFEQINRGNPLWQRPKGEPTDEQYTELYKHLSHDYEAPLGRSHFKMEGSLELSGIVYVPKKAPFDLFEQGKKRGIRLFVKRVFILDDCEELLPNWLRFMKGVVDSDDLPLNVSRELLQDSSVVRAIKKNVIKKSMEVLEEIAKDRPSDYQEFFRTFGPVLKEGVATDAEYKDRIASLLRYESTFETSAEGGAVLVSLAEYKARAKEGQKEIYYLYGSSRTAVATSPYLEALRKHGFEVLLMSDPVDEWACEALGEFDGMKLVSAMAAELPAAGEEEKKSAEAHKTKLEPLFARVKAVLGDRVKEVRASTRLTETAACLSLSEGQVPAYMEALLRANGRPVPNSPRIFELNPDHALVAKLLEAPDSAVAEDAICLLFDQAKLVEGSSIDDPQKFSERMSRVMSAALAGGHGGGKSA
jgi:molecular chaperone HtpG